MNGDSIIAIQDTGFVRIGSQQDTQPALRSCDNIFMLKRKGTPVQDSIGNLSQHTGSADKEAA